MKSRHLINLMTTIAMVMLTTAFAGCALSNRTDRYGTPAVYADQVITDLTPHIEELYLSWHELDQTHKDIKFLERGFLFDADDRQLGYIQMAGLYVQDASVRIRQRWEQLSVLHYIRAEMVRDYLTVNAKGLASAIKEVGYDEQFLTIYGSYITHEAVTQDLNRALELIKKNRDVLDQILAKLLPIANAPSPVTAL